MGEERAGESGQGRRWGRSKTGAGQQEASPRLCRWTQTRRTREWQGVLPLPIAVLLMPVTDLCCPFYCLSLFFRCLFTDRGRVGAPKTGHST